MTEARSSLEELKALYDLSMDIQRWEDDREFSDNGGTIHYIFDENIFELFVYPFKHFRQTAWSQQFSGRLPKRERRLAMRNALLSSEALFGGALPGQRQSKIYLTEWHRWELLDRLTEIITQEPDDWLERGEEASKRLIQEQFAYWKADYSPTRIQRSADASACRARPP